MAGYVRLAGGGGGLGGGGLGAGGLGAGGPVGGVPEAGNSLSGGEVASGGLGTAQEDALLGVVARVLAPTHLTLWLSDDDRRG